MKFKILLFQPYLRKPMLNFGLFLKNFVFVVPHKTTGLFYKSQLPEYSKEINRTKVNKINKLRRYLGFPNLRVRWESRADILFTYGLFLITNKPYCVYIENGLAPYNYDPRLASKFFAKYLVSKVIRHQSCKRLIFMSEAARKSFLASVSYNPKTREAIEQKSVVIYPLVTTAPARVPKNFSENLKLLFVGQFYIKGGIELLIAFKKIRKTYPSVTLTIVTPLHVVADKDQKDLRATPGVDLIDADLPEQKMQDLYERHDIFILPTYRDSFGMVLVEALAWGMPLIVTDQFATTEIALEGYNALVFKHHPLKDYDPESYKFLGKYYNPKDFYTDLFRLQKEKALKPVEDFLVASIKNFLDNPGRLEEYSKNSLQLYRDKFDAEKISDQIETVFVEALK